ncbi:MAG: phosphotransferase [Actinomycetota bacterium]|nr:phosphotransferase [Actinomycetota bacterium]
MPKLCPDDHPRITQEFVARCLRQYGLAAGKADELKDGIENATVKVPTGSRQVVALRVYRQNKKSRLGVQAEVEFMEFLRTHRVHSIPVPEVLRTKAEASVTRAEHDGKDWLCMVMNFIEGEALDHYDDELIDRLARLQAQMHLLGSEFANTHTPEGSSTTPSSLPVPDEAFPEEPVTSPALRDFLDNAKLYRVKLRPTLPLGWCHLDFGLGNLLFDEQKRVVGLLDFDDSAFMPSVVCLGYMLRDVLWVDGDTSRLEPYVAAYETVRPLTAEEKCVLPRIMLLRHYHGSGVDARLRGADAAAVGKMVLQERRIRELAFC